MYAKSNRMSSGQTTTAVPFRAGLFETDAEGARLLAGRCTDCGNVMFPRTVQCPRCGSEQVETTALHGRGTVYASTVVHVPAPVGIKPPYAYGLVDLEDAPLRVFGLFSGDAKSFKPGARVSLVIEPLRRDAEGRTLEAYKFRTA
jgi:uncharacterized OB-fold protein